MEMSRNERLIALGLAALAAIMAAAAIAAPARAASYGNGFEVAKFKIEVNGSSNTTWHRNYEAANECDVSDHSYGRERLSFETTKPIYVTATHMRGEFNPLLFATNAQLGLPARAKIQRSFTPAISTPAKDCGGANGGGAEATIPDCGTKVVKPWLLNFEFSSKKKNAVQLHSDGGIRVPYANCPGAGFTFPFLLDEQGTGEARKPLFAEISQDELFDPKFRKWITIGDGKWTESSETWLAQTDVHWAISFTRLKGKVASR